ncbi:PREDICTED: solute carrier organic anion transporter family member 4C1-like [Priapulus caudatus]|uniref:Solute carrier organic anion transporter family member 4C1-like n=1 Tax=Priapulus caudatus TaxID=37621 RepID=A0ABM1F7S6_PRICU|nr:PREDICTED: solute carrier organic anion transporter family member 4C1-like [Priapulus caudatus]
MPGPIIGGAAIDASCILWQIDACGETGSCWMYDNDQLRYTLHGIALGVKCAATCLYAAAFLTCKGKLAGDDNAYETDENQGEREGSGKEKEERVEMLRTTPAAAT